MALSHSYVASGTLPVLQDGDRCTEDEYYAFEENSEERWEFVADKSVIGEPLTMGTIRAMVGGTLDHSVISINLTTALNNSLRRLGNQTCRVSGSDLKIRTAEGRNTYPDVSVICGQPNYYGRRTDTVTKPILVAEVLSPSTESYDRGEKLASYRSIPSLEQILLIATETASVDFVTRVSDGWEETTVSGLESKILLPSLSIEITISDVYALIDIE